MRDLYGRRRVSKKELTNEPVTPAMPQAMQNVNMFAGAPAPIAPIQRPVFENQFQQVLRPNFSNIISMIQRRRRPMGM